MYKVNLEEFLLEFAKELEIEEDLSPSELLGEIKEYDSMGKINISMVIERLFDFEIPYDVLDSQDTIQSLYKYCVDNAK